MNRNSLPEYAIWRTMRARCRCKTSERFEHYGARGITVCAEWNDFWRFLADMGPRPSPRHSIERNDVDGNYEPSNCRWATQTEQVRNTRKQQREDIGVTYSKRLGCWIARITVAKKPRHLGTFETKAEAIAARQAAKLRYWVEGHDINEPQPIRLYRNNTSGTPGVSFDKSKGRWRAYRRFEGRRVHLGTFTSFEEAQRARTNFMDQQQGMSQ